MTKSEEVNVGVWTSRGSKDSHYVCFLIAIRVAGVAVGEILARITRVDGELFAVINGECRNFLHGRFAVAWISEQLQKQSNNRFELLGSLFEPTSETALEEDEADVVERIVATLGKEPISSTGEFLENLTGTAETEIPEELGTFEHEVSEAELPVLPVPQTEMITSLKHRPANSGAALFKTGKTAAALKRSSTKQ
jgi:hypothetical protein